MCGNIERVRFWVRSQWAHFFIIFNKGEKKMKKTVLVLLLLVMIFSMIGCGNSGSEQKNGDSNNDETKKSVTDIILSQNSIELTEGETKTISFTVLPDDVQYTLTWSSLDSSIATVNDNGLVKAISVGQVNVLVRSDNGISAVCSVKVNPKSAYDSLTKDEKDFVDTFLKAISQFKNPSSVRIEAIEYHSLESTWGTIGKWQVYVKAENGFGGYNSTLYCLSQYGVLSKAPIQYSISSVPVGMFDTKRINEAIQERIS